MSGATTPRSAGEPKAMSKALQNMKFMKRAAAADSATSASSSTPTQLGFTEPFPKRQKLSSRHSNTTPLSEFGSRIANTNNSPDTPSRPRFFEGGETEWVINIALPLPSVSSSEEEDEEEDIWSHHNRTIGRQSYGGFKRKKTTLAVVSSTTTPVEGSESGELSALGSGEETQATPVRRTQCEEDAEGRRLDRVDFSRMDGISGTGGGGGMKSLKGGFQKERDRYAGSKKNNHNHDKSKKRKTM